MHTHIRAHASATGWLAKIHVAIFFYKFTIRLNKKAIF